MTEPTIHGHARSHKKFKQALEDFKEEIRNEGNLVLRKYAMAAYNGVIAHSPIYTGRYVLSHRVGIGHKDTSVNKPILHVAQFKADAIGKGAMLWRVYGKLNALRATAKAKILTATLLDRKIIISNSVEYAEQVEYLGWHFGQHHVPPYHVYGKTYNKLQALSYTGSKASFPEETQIDVSSLFGEIQ